MMPLSNPNMQANVLDSAMSIRQLGVGLRLGKHGGIKSVNFTSSIMSGNTADRIVTHHAVFNQTTVQGSIWNIYECALRAHCS